MLRLQLPTLLLMCFPPLQKTDRHGNTPSHHMINIYLCLHLNERKDNLPLMDLFYYSYLSQRETRAAGLQAGVQSQNQRAQSVLDPSLVR